MPRIWKRTKEEIKWTEAENTVCRTLHPDYKAILQALRHRTLNSVKNQCNKLGLVPKRHQWTTTEIKRLRELWPTNISSKELNAAFPNVSKLSIYGEARLLKLGKRPLAPLKPSGNFICDAIRHRARLLGYNNKELDEIAGTSPFWYKANWRNKNTNYWQIFIKTAKALGGELSVVWPDDGECIDNIDVGEPK